MADRDGKDGETTTVTTAMPPPSIPARAVPQGTTDTTSAAAETPPDPAPVASLGDSAPARSEPTRDRSRPIFLPMALGGLVAGLMGYVIAWAQIGPASPFASTAGGSAVVDYQDQIDQLRADLDALPAPQAFEAPEPFDASDIESRLDSLETGQSDLTARLDAPRESAPLIGDEAQQAAVDYLSQQIADQSGNLQSQLDALQSRLDAQVADAEAARQQAADAATREASRAAIARVQTAIEAGGPMTDEIAALEQATGEPAPEALTAVAETGVTSMSTLRETFPAAARDALSAARSAGEAGEDGGGFSSFLRTQFNARSTTPQDGSSVDAILSRADVDLDEGRLADAVDKVQSLPPSAQSALSDWLAQAEARLSAVEAVDGLAATMTDN